MRRLETRDLHSQPGDLVEVRLKGTGNPGVGGAYIFLGWGRDSLIVWLPDPLYRVSLTGSNGCPYVWQPSEELCTYHVVSRIEDSE